MPSIAAGPTAAAVLSAERFSSKPPPTPCTETRDRDHFALRLGRAVRHTGVSLFREEYFAAPAAACVCVCVWQLDGSGDLEHLEPAGWQQKQRN